MSDEPRFALALALAFGATLALTPFAIKLAKRTDFLDRPRGYKGHATPTPYLGGIAVVGGFAIAAVPSGEALGRLWPILAAAVALCVVGTIDDRYALGLGPRLLAEVGAAAGLFAAGFGWEYLDSEAANLALTILFVAGVVNAFNLMDNQDGAAGTVTMVAAAGIGALAMIEGDAALAALCLGLSGACAGFLHYNLATPSRIFLGDGGSMPLGVVLAAAIMSLEGGAEIGWAMILVTVVLVGLPALDTALVIVSRLRRGASVHRGARDHLTHRLLVPLGSVRRVAVALAAGQALLCIVGIGLYQVDQAVALAGTSACILFGLVTIALLETPRWAPALQEPALYEATSEDLGMSGMESDTEALTASEVAAVGATMTPPGSEPDEDDVADSGLRESLA